VEVAGEVVSEQCGDEVKLVAVWEGLEEAGAGCPR
jgi:hypothetical protein